MADAFHLRPCSAWSHCWGKKRENGDGEGREGEAREANNIDADLLGHQRAKVQLA